MKKIGLPLILLFFLLFTGKMHTQTLVCNDLVQVALDENCTYTLVPDDILEGTVLSNCVVELDKVPPFGNGPWVAPVLVPSDVGKTYMVRVRHLPSGIMCWGNVKVEDKRPPVLSCQGFTEIDLGVGNPAGIAASSLNITSVESCGAYTLSPPSFQFDCADLGIQLVQLTATDVAGNSATCKHTVLVSGAEACDPCVSHCPDPVSVSYGVGNNQLLQDFQNNNWAAFDAFGNALFDNGCNYVDSTYSIDYQTGAVGQSWFVRQWVWLDGGGQPTVCRQHILFPTENLVTIAGQVYLDGDDDCILDANEQRVSAFPLQLTLHPSGLTQTIYPQSNGSYSAQVIFDVSTTDATLSLILPPGVNPVCASAVDIPNSTQNPAVQFDFGIQTAGNCPKMQVDMGDVFLRRCNTNLFNISYCNTGLDTAYNAYVTLDLDPLIHLVSADLPFTVAGADSLYTFQLGNVPPFFCGSFKVISKVSCAAVLGQTLCNQAHIYPDEPCSGAWQGASIVADAVCDGDSVQLILKNVGPQNMGSPLNYIVVEDFIMYKEGNFQLDAGETFMLTTEANGATWRIEAGQAPGFPEVSSVAAAVEGCGGINTPGVILAYGQPADPAASDIHCGPVLASCDPNDKTAIPTGFTEDHIIRANQPIDYKIRFQNTGNDTAFKVVIVDTLSALLDARTLETGASSHPYRLEIYPGNILHFVFDPIALPDSNVNEPASHGYVHFTIHQQPDLPDGSRIENQVAIYFDQNDPVFTNTAYHTVGYPFVPNPPLLVSVLQTAPTCAGASNGGIQLVVEGGIPPYTYHWNDPNLQGAAPSGLPAGIYSVTVEDSYRGEWIHNFMLTEPDSMEITLTASGAVGNEANGSATAVATGGSGAYTYLWSNNATSATISNLTAGLYSVTVTDANGCTQVGAVTVDALVGAGAPSLASRIRVWPNPAHDRLTVELHRVLPELLRIDLLAADGRLLRRFQASELRPVLQLELGGEQAPGLILIVFHARDGAVVAEKVLVK